VPKIVPNHGEIDTRLKKGDRAAVAEHVRRDLAAPQLGLIRGSEMSVLPQQVGHPISCQRPATGISKERFIDGQTLAGRQPPNGNYSIAPERTKPITVTFTM
jgi:hypothetical protein